MRATLPLHPHPAIEVRALSTMSPTHAPLRQVTFSVAAGSVAVLTGPDHAGKATLMQLLAGHLIPTGGRDRLSGIDLRTARLAATERIGYLPARAPDWGHMSVRDIVSFGARARAVPTRMVDARLDAVVEATGLADRLTAPWSSLDRGWQRQAAIALLLLQAPDTLLLDHALDDLPLGDRARLAAVLASLRGRVTLFLAAAKPALGPLSCDQMLVLEAGQLAHVDARTALRTGARRRASSALSNF